MKNIDIKEYAGEGLNRVVVSGDWFVGVKNYKPANDVATLKELEKHSLTDEVFVLLQGNCSLVIDESANKDCSDFQCVPMEAGKVYSIHKGVWHTTILNKDCKMILVENSNTSMENSEILQLKSEDIKKLQATLKTQGF